MNRDTTIGNSSLYLTLVGMDDARVHATLAKLQADCEDKILRIQELRELIADRNLTIDGYKAKETIHAEAAFVQLKSSQQQCKLG